MAFDMTTGDAILKEMYPDDVLKNLTYQDRPFLAMVPKDERFFGDAKVIPVTYGNPQGRSVTFGTAVDNKGSSQVSKFTITHVRDYSLASIDNLLIEASQSNEGAFIDGLQFEVDNAVNSLSNSIASALFRSGGGEIGVVSAVSGTSLTLTDVNDCVNFEKGMEIVADTTAGTGTVHTGSATITHVNRDTGVLTTDSNWTSQIASVAAGDYLFQEGDFGGKLKGLSAWIPDSAPGATAFFGVARNTDTVRLGGCRISSTDVSGLPLEEKILHACARLAREGGRPDVCFVSHEKFRDLAISLGSKVVYDGVSVADVGFEGIRLVGAVGPVKVVPDRWCPNNRAYVLTLSSWKLLSAGAAPHILDRDGKLIRESSSDAYEVRVGFYGNLSCKAPGWNAVIDLS